MARAICGGPRQGPEPGQGLRPGPRAAAERNVETAASGSRRTGSGLGCAAPGTHAGVGTSASADFATDQPPSLRCPRRSGQCARGPRCAALSAPGAGSAPGMERFTCGERLEQPPQNATATAAACHHATPGGQWRAVGAPNHTAARTWHCHCGAKLHIAKRSSALRGCDERLLGERQWQRGWRVAKPETIPNPGLCADRKACADDSQFLPSECLSEVGQDESGCAAVTTLAVGPLTMPSRFHFLAADACEGPHAITEPGCRQ
mmetsp:Transcript_61967/g.134297  ORF Transcript_61967/g.134297 Transcript_61967/m.134297 type:complete len:262 (+) Transcript_61967:540-1325(+)